MAKFCTWTRRVYDSTIAGDSWAKIVILGFLLIGLLFLAATSASAEISIAAGKKGGGYDKYANELGQRISQRGETVTITNYNGSDEITLAMCSGRAQVGITQIDAIFARSNEGCQLVPAGIYGSEYAVMFVPPDSDIDELSDLTGESRVLIDTIGSGTDLFWRTIVKIETDDNGNKSTWAQAKTVNDFIDQATVLAEFGDIDAVVFVRRQGSGEFEFLANAGWKMVEFYDKDVNDQMFNGKPLYEAAKVNYKTARGKVTWNWGYEVRSFIVTTNDRDVITVVRNAGR